MDKHFWGLLRKYCLESSLPVLKYFYQYPDKVSRCFWSLNLTTALTVSVLITWRLYSRFLEMPTRITLENRYESILNFPYPTITLCSPTQLTVSAIKYFNRTLVDPAPGDLGLDLEKTLPQMISLYRGVSEKLDEENLKRLQDILDLNRFTIPELMDRVPLSCEKFLKSCWFEGKAYNCTDLFKPIITAFGYCCAFNSKYYYKDKRIRTNPNFKNYKVRGTGLFYALTVVTDYEPNDVLEDTLFYAGATRVFITDVTEFPTSYETSLVDSGGEAMVNLHATVTYCSDVVKSLAPWSRGCNFEDEQNITFFKAYRRSDCIHSCYVEAVFKACNCMLVYVPNIRDQNICKLTDMSCVDTNQKKKMSSKECNCPKDCLSRRYNTHLTLGNLNAKPYLLESSASPIKDLTLNDSSSILMFLFMKPTYTRMKQETVISIVNLISNLGGVFGLFLGCSGISLLEVIFYMYRGVKIHSRSNTGTKVRKI